MVCTDFNIKPKSNEKLNNLKIASFQLKLTKEVCTNFNIKQKSNEKLQRSQRFCPVTVTIP